MEKRKYCPGIVRIWGDDIKKAEELVMRGEADPSAVEGIYEVKLDPEDFLDLCAGRWHAPGFAAQRRGGGE